MLTRLRIALCVVLVLLQSAGIFSAQIATGQTRRAPTSRAHGVDVKTGLQLRSALLSEAEAASKLFARRPRKAGPPAQPKRPADFP